MPSRGLYQRILPFLRPYRARLVLVLLATLARPACNAAKVWLLKILVDDVLAARRPDLLGLVAGGYIAITLVKAAASFVDDYVGGWVGSHVVRDLRLTVYDHLQGLSLRFYHQQRLGDLLTRLTADVAAIEDLLLTGLADALVHAITIVVFAGLLFVLDARLAAIALVALPALAFVARASSERTRVAQVGLREATSSLTSTAEEGLSAVALVKSFAREPREGERFAAASRDVLRARLRVTWLRAVFVPAIDVVATTGTVLVVWLGGRAVLDGGMTLGSLVVFLGYLGALYAPVQALIRLGSTLQRARVGGDRVLDILDRPLAELEPRGRPPLRVAQGRVTFRDVWFGYDRAHPVLRGLNLAIEPGEIVALVGASGAGKTTIVSLLLAYYEVDAGAVSIAGEDLRRFSPRSVREHVAAVLQEPMLFQTSIRENLRYGRLDATDAEIEQAARRAGADEFITRLPEGYETLVGPRGARLSGGERQRLALARALLKRARVLVLDEATSALDPATEAAVLSSLRSSCEQQAVLLVAHRLSAVRHADRIAVLTRGQVSEFGTHDDLLARDGAYAHFYRLQVGLPADESSLTVGSPPLHVAAPV